MIVIKTLKAKQTVYRQAMVPKDTTATFEDELECRSAEKCPRIEGDTSAVITGVVSPVVRRAIR